MTNLEDVLAAFETDKQTQLAAMQIESDVRVKDLEARVASLQEQAESSKQLLVKQREDMKSLQQLKADLNVSNGLVQSLRNEVVKLQDRLSESHARLSEALTSADRTLVDKRLIKNTVCVFMCCVVLCCVVLCCVVCVCVCVCLFCLFSWFQHIAN